MSGGCEAAEWQAAAQADSRMATICKGARLTLLLNTAPAASLFSILLRMQDAGRIDAQGPPRGQPSGEQPDHDQQRHAGEHQTPHTRRYRTQGDANSDFALATDDRMQRDAK